LHSGSSLSGNRPGIISESFGRKVWRSWPALGKLLQIWVESVIYGDGLIKLSRFWFRANIRLAASRRCSASASEAILIFGASSSMVHALAWCTWTGPVTGWKVGWISSPNACPSTR